MSITTELANSIAPHPETCGACAAGLVFLPDGHGRYETHTCPCMESDPIEYVTEIDAPTPDPMNTDEKDTP